MMGSEPVPATWFQLRGAPGSAAWPRPDDGALTRAPSSSFCSSPAIAGVGTRAGAWSYLGCYPRGMVTKRSVSLSDDVAKAVEIAAKEDGVSFSAWLSGAAERQLRVRQGLRGVAAWESESGSLTAEEIAAGEALLGRLLSGVSGMASRVRRRP